MVILQRDRHVKVTQAIRQLIQQHLNAWEAKLHQIRVKKTQQSWEQYLTAARYEGSEDQG